MVRLVSKGDAVFSYFVCSPPEFEELGPHIEDLVIAAECIDGSDNFRYKFMGQRAYRQKWVNFDTDFLGPTAPSPDPVTSGVYATRLRLAAPRIQILCGYKNDAGTTFDPAVLSAQAYVRIFR